MSEPIKIEVRASNLARYTGHNRFDPLDKVVQDLLILNKLVKGKMVASKLEAGISNLPEEEFQQLKTDLKLPKTATQRDVTRCIQQELQPSLSSETEDKSREAIDTAVKKVNSQVLQTLVPSIKQDVRMGRGCKRETRNLDTIQMQRGIRITERNSKIYEKELYRCEDYVVKLRGRMDGRTGLSDDGATIIESKNRTKQLFEELRGYEQVQLESYMFLTGRQKALLTEHYNETNHCIEYSHDEEFWQECLANMVEFMETHVRPALPRIMVEEEASASAAPTSDAVVVAATSAPKKAAPKRKLDVVPATAVAAQVAGSTVVKKQTRKSGGRKKTPTTPKFYQLPSLSFR